MDISIDFSRRFGGVARLYGEHGLAKLKASHVVVIGIGGVGSWAVEALARNAVGRLTLIDLDNVAESNFNRQIHAVNGNEGKPKVSAMAERICAINPLVEVHAIDDFVSAENVSQLLPSHELVILDCTDDVKAKIAISAYCKQHVIQLYMSGGAGGRLNPAHLKIADLARVTGDKLLAKVRNQLRCDYGFPKTSSTKKSSKFGIQCVYSDEAVVKPGDVCDLDDNQVNTGLNCAGYGSSVCVTAPFGFAMAQLAINDLIATD